MSRRIVSSAPPFSHLASSSFSSSTTSAIFLSKRFTTACSSCIRPLFASFRSQHPSFPFAPSHRLSIPAANASLTLSQARFYTTPNSKMVAEDFESVLKGKYPAKLHAQRSVQQLRANGATANGVLYLEACMTKLQEDNDSPVHFRQRRFFYYLTGSNMADCHYAYDIQAAKSILFIPPIDPEDVIWSGLPVTIDDALKIYDVDEVRLTTEVNSTLAELAAANPKSTLYTLEGQVSEGISFAGFETTDLKTLKPAIETARVVKDEYEIALIRKANKISGEAHKAVVQRGKTAKNEQELEAAFLERCVSHGAKEMAYHPIMASGTGAATLHYVDNSKPMDGNLNVLVDAGAEYRNYASDITRTFPLSGKFTKESRAIYDIVLKMQTETTKILKAGVKFDDAHVLAHQIAIEGLIDLGILKGTKEEIFAARTSAAFFPHGLGHYLGLDTHDVGGNPNRNDPDKLFPNLRLRGVIPAGSVVTNEPGIYFCEFIIKPYLKDPVHSKFIDESVLNQYWQVGGVRIEDNILITENGCENLTDAIKEAAEVEALMA